MGREEGQARDEKFKEEEVAESQVEDMSFKEAEVPRCLTSVQNSSSAWFRRRFNPDVPLFLTSEHLVEWVRLSAERMPYGLKGLAEDDAYKALEPLPTTDHWTWVNNFHDNRDRPTCLRCALVGDSAALKGADRGLDIDEHDLVIRVGDGGKEGHADDVGTKTNLYLYNPEMPLDTGNIKKHADVYFIYMASKVPDYHLISKLMKEEPQNNHHGSRTGRKVIIKPQQLRVLHPDFLNYVYELWLERAGHKATAAQVMLVLAFHICDHVDTYGFDDSPVTSQFDPPDNGLESHDYFYLTKGMERPVYNHLFEKKLRQKMMQEGLVQMFMP
ncbi:CMP-N-acetylneuraminate-beta-galactosamide-alpha-2,3-sialyltransferase 1-like [Branchiostoma lanceolatum]|uniref:CMP-N-acetylneuraminate-beta-galactosamide- alpha-2,3-sialyltransferase 1-like n=1 Tax=Branchiostoma lanceolatum TaxID=7740 RepID=UPI0034519392